MHEGCQGALPWWPQHARTAVLNCISHFLRPAMWRHTGLRQPCVYETLPCKVFNKASRSAAKINVGSSANLTSDTLKEGFKIICHTCKCVILAADEAEEGCGRCYASCSKKRSCPHPCFLQCHSGVCPPCKVQVTESCHCGRKLVTAPCHQVAQVTHNFSARLPSSSETIPADPPVLQYVSWDAHPLLGNRLI